MSIVYTETWEPTLMIRQSEELRWKQLSIDFMSDNDADPLAVVHQLR